MGENALKYAQSCLDLCRENNIGDFDLAFAYEALLRASAVLGDKLAFNQYKKFAQDASGKIGKEEDRDYFLSELSNIPGFEDS
jgi:hypothetical protein